MEPTPRRDREYIATLCALSTIGASATGLTFGFEEDVPQTSPTSATTSTKRKAPGSETSSLPILHQPTRSTTVRRIVSQPTSGTTITNGEDSQLHRSTSRSFFRRRTLLDTEPTSSDASTSTISRGSSVSLHRRLRSRTGESHGDIRDSSSGSTSWLRRISMISSISGSPASSRPDTPSVSLSNTSATPMLADELGTSQLTPNKLVKRSSSHRALSSDNLRLLSLRRPATSHQRTADFRRFSFQKPMAEEPASAAQRWRPYFDNEQSKASTAQPRKRHTSGMTRETAVKTVSGARAQRPILLLGTSVVPRGDSDDLDDITDPRTPAPLPVIRRKNRPISRRDRRVFTDPGLQDETSPQIMFERSRSSPLSPISHPSTFDIDLPSGTPAFSDPTTASSDNVFTDDDSVEFHSDTAYDSLATRATVSSHSGLRGLQIGTMFDEDGAPRASNTLVGLEELIEAGSLDKRVALKRPIDPQMETDNTGTANTDLEEFQNRTSNSRLSHSLTPPRIEIEEEDEFTSTPVPRRNHSNLIDMHSSPPSMVTEVGHEPNSMHAVQNSIAALALDNGEVDWDKTTDPDSSFDDASILPQLPTTDNWAVDHQHLADSDFHGMDHNGQMVVKKSTIFDWSEHHKSGGDFWSGSSPRPKTVHGKHGNDNRGSRSAGRRGPSGVHLRSQSVPVARENNPENELAYPVVAKFGTWGLGNKGPSEEWSDDFEFDDIDESSTGVPLGPSQQNGSVHAMKVPQSIIDRQASVHGQFGQVQEFMLLVEELKRLRLQGSILQLLKSQSSQLWEDAESIINLATINDDEEDLDRPRSPASPGSVDPFDEDTPSPSNINQPPASKTEYLRSRTSISRRSISSPATPPVGRPRGESLAQVKSFLQTIHQKRGGPESSPAEVEIHQREKLHFDTQDLRDMVVRAGVITRALKEIIRKAEGVAVSPTKSPKRFTDPAFSQIFNHPDSSPSPSLMKPSLPKSRSANSYLGNGTNSSNENELSGHMQMLTVV